MRSTRFGTDPERYLGSGIIALSQLPEPSEDDLIIHAKELKELARRLEPRTWKPWQKKSHFKAEISRRYWKNRNIGKEQRLDGRDYPELRFGEDADIRMIESMAMLQAVRSSKASRWEQRINNHERRWVVDVFCKDGSESSEWAIESCHLALCRFFSSPTRNLVTSHWAKDLLPAHIYKDAGLVRKTPGVADAFRELSRLPSMWITKSFNFLTDVRKCFCSEEIENYVRVIIHQWEEITLGWDDRVVPYVNVKSIHLLQSLAPRFSKHDRDNVEREFRKNSIFPGLNDPQLRKKVEKAICRQGPILTLSTFAKDVRLLQSRVREPMTKLLDDMDREDDTLRKRIVEILEDQFDELSRSSNLSIAFRGQKKETVERCYQNVFLHTIRNDLPIGSVTQAQLSSFVKHEFDPSCSAGTSRRSNQSADALARRAPAPLDMSEPEHVNIEKRHGVELFNERAVVQHLYSHGIKENSIPRGGLSLSFMAQHIVRVFLFGEAAFERVQVASSSLAEQIVPPVQTVPARLSIDSCLSGDSAGSTSLTSFSRALYQPELTSMHAHRPFPAIERTITGLNSFPISQSASIVGAETSPVPSSCLSRVSAKRSSPISMHDGVRHYDIIKTAKRLRMTGSEHEQVEKAQQWGNSLPVWSQEAAVAEVETHSTANPIVNDTLDAGATELVGHFDHTALSTSPSTYSRDIYSPASSSVEGSLPSIQTYMKDFSQNPWDNVSERDVERAFPLMNDCSNVVEQPATPLGRHTRSTETEAVLQRFRQPPIVQTRPWPVRYIGNKAGMICPATSAAADTSNFFASQMDVNPSSTFRYKCPGGSKHVSSAKQLQIAIERYELKEVFVGSDSLGSTDPRVTSD